MNNTRRGLLQKIAATLEEIEGQIQALLEEEQSAYDNMPEALQDTEKGENILTACDALETATTTIQDARDSIEEATNV